MEKDGMWKFLVLLSFILVGDHLVTADKKEEEKEQETTSVYNGCNQTITDAQGIILSPGFPSAYNNSMYCTWNIQVEPTRTVLISFRVFDLETSTNCMYDNVKIYNGPTTNHMVLGKFCGAFRPGDTTGTSNQLLMTFETDSDNLYPKSGFYAIFVSVPQRLAVPDSCGGVLRAPKGEFHSVNFPKSNYPNHVTCTWYIRSDADKVIILSFPKFTLEVSEDCKYDSVSVMSGSSNGTRVIGKYCRTSEVPENIVSDGNEMYVTFTTDSSGNEVGFLAYYHTEYADLYKTRIPEKGSEKNEIATTTTQPITSKKLKPVTTPQKTKPFFKPKPSITSTAATSTAPVTEITTVDPDIPDCSGPCVDQSDITTSCISEYSILGKLVEIKSISSHGMVLGVNVIKTMKSKTKALKKLRLPSKKSEITITLPCPTCFDDFHKGSKYIFSGKSVNIVDKGTVNGPHFAQPYDKKVLKLLKKTMKRCGKSSRKARRHAKRRRGGKKNREA